MFNVETVTTLITQSGTTDSKAGLVYGGAIAQGARVGACLAQHAAQQGTAAPRQGPAPMCGCAEFASTQLCLHGALSHWCAQ